MLGKISEREAGIQISKYFPWCPFCCFEDLEMDLKPERTHDSVSCSNCGAMWEMQIQEKLRHVKLVAPSVGRKGKELLGRDTEPKFWQNRAWLCILTRRTPEKVT